MPSAAPLGLLLGLLAAAAPAAAADDEGARLFAERCAVCHQHDMKGVAGVYPPIAEAVGRYLQIEEGRAYLVHVLAFGLAGSIEAEGQRYAGIMPAVPHYTDAQIATVLNHVLVAGTGKPAEGTVRPLTPEEVTRHRARPLTPAEVAQERATVVERLETADAARLYVRQCMGCHRPDASGVPGAVPRMAGFAGYFAHLPEGRAFLVRVPGVARAPLTDAEVATVLNFVLETFSAPQLPAGFAPFTADEVRAHRGRPLLDVSGERAAIVARLREAGILPPDH